MRYAYQLNGWGGVIGSLAAVTNISAGHYLPSLTPRGDAEPGLRAIPAAGFTGVDIFDGNQSAYVCTVSGPSWN
jgi:hypothetical protein